MRSSPRLAPAARAVAFALVLPGCLAWAVGCGSGGGTSGSGGSTAGTSTTATTTDTEADRQAGLAALGAKACDDPLETIYDAVDPPAAWDPAMRGDILRCAFDRKVSADEMSAHFKDEMLPQPP